MEDGVDGIQHPGLIEDDLALKEVFLPEDLASIVEEVEELDGIGDAAGFSHKRLNAAKVRVRWRLSSGARF